MGFYKPLCQKKTSVLNCFYLMFMNNTNTQTKQKRSTTKKNVSPLHLFDTL